MYGPSGFCPGVMNEWLSYGTVLDDVLQCRHSSLELSTSALAFIKSHPLMHNCVDTLDSRPLYFTKHDEAFTRLAVDYVAQYTLFYLASSKLSVSTARSVSDLHVEQVSVIRLRSDTCCVRLLGRRDDVWRCFYFSCVSTASPLLQRRSHRLDRTKLN